MFKKKPKQIKTPNLIPKMSLLFHIIRITFFCKEKWLEYMEYRSRDWADTTLAALPSLHTGLLSLPSIFLSLNLWGGQVLVRELGETSLEKEDVLWQGQGWQCPGEGQGSRLSAAAGALPWGLCSLSLDILEHFPCWWKCTAGSRQSCALFSSWLLHLLTKSSSLANLKITNFC